MFLSALVVTSAGENQWRLIEELNYYMDDGHFISVPIGFVTDLASIPRPFRNIFSVNGNHREAAVLHDWGYFRQGAVTDGLVLSRSEVDALFLQAMERSGIGLFKRKAMYYAVRLGGFIAWRQ